MFKLKQVAECRDVRVQFSRQSILGRVLRVEGTYIVIGDAVTLSYRLVLTRSLALITTS